MAEAPAAKWECPACGEMNRADRPKCNNCSKPRPVSDAPADAPPRAATTAGPNGVGGDAGADTAAAPRKRRRGWDSDESQSAKVASSAASAALIESVVKSWKPSVSQLKAMSVAELQPILKTWKVHIEPSAFNRDAMLAKALKLIHNIEEYDPLEIVD
mmetsp:Transcript_89327/g.251474  ORF Transcript_89327/g.251474 Transcript_89327/m.251474 type:complete len:158 (+) Transcript_89327:80-553(+)